MCILSYLRSKRFMHSLIHDAVINPKSGPYAPSNIMTFLENFIEICQKMWEELHSQEMVMEPSFSETLAH